MTNPNPTARKNIKPGLTVPSGLDPEHEKFLQSVKEHLQGADGARGQPKERFVTLEDLERVGLIKTGTLNGRGVITKLLVATTASASSSQSDSSVSLLDGLSDVLVTSPITDGSVLLYRSDNAQWINGQFQDSSELAWSIDILGPTVSVSLIDGSIAYARVADASALSVLGRSANSSGVLADIQAGTDNQVLRRSGTTVGFGALNLASSDAVTGDLPFTNIAQLAGLSVAGRSVAGAGDIAAITAGTDDRVLRQTSSALNFGQLTVGMAPDAVWTFAKLQNADAVSVLGRSANSSGVMDEIAAGANDRLLRRTADALNFGQLTAGMFPNTVVPDAALSSNIPLLDGVNVFTYASSGSSDPGLKFESSRPIIMLRDTDISDERWLWQVNGQTFRMDSINDAGTVLNNIFIAEQTSGALDYVGLLRDSSGVDSIRVDRNSTSGETRMFVYDVDNATLERVSVGSADSGGTGFKLLRIPN